MKEWRSGYRRLLAGVLTFALILGNVIDVSVLTVSAEMEGQTDAGTAEQTAADTSGQLAVDTAHPTGSQTATIVSFEELSEEWKDQALPIGAAESDILFPESLTAAVIRGTSEPKKAPAADDDPEETEQVIEIDLFGSGTDSAPEQSEDTKATDPSEDEILIETEALATQELSVDTGVTDDISVEPEVSADPVNTADAGGDSVLDQIQALLLPGTLTVHAAETEAEIFSEEPAGNGTDGQTTAETVTLENITWRLDAERSDADTFQADEAANGFFYTYVPVLPDTVTVTENGAEVTLALTLGEGVELPEIHVLIGESSIAVFSLEGHYDANGFCTGYEFNASGQWVKKTGEDACTEETCSGYQPAEQRADGAYEISNAGQLYWFAGMVNGDEAVCTGDIAQNRAANAVLTADITVNTGVLNADGTPSENAKEFRSWTPIGRGVDSYDGENEDCYDGSFDGGNHIVRGLYFDNRSTDGGYGVGLFGATATQANISNVNIADSYFNGYSHVGGVCGKFRGQSLRNCSNAGTVSGTQTVGGVCGIVSYSSYQIVTNCFNTGTVSGYWNVGGVCGQANDAHNLTNCYNMGTVSASSNQIGSLCGSSPTNGKFNTNCYCLDDTATDRDSQYKVTLMTKNQFESGEVAWLLYQGCTIEEYDGSSSIFDGSVWGQQIGVDASPVLDDTKKVYRVYVDDCQTYSYSNDSRNQKPVHSFDANGFCTKCDAYQPATQNADGAYEIGNAGQLYWFAGLVNGDEAVCAYGIIQNRAANAVLTADITVNTGVLKEDGTLSDHAKDFRSWTPISGAASTDDFDSVAGYEGNFDGRNHTVSGLYFNERKNYVGLIGKAAKSGASISNVNIADSYFSAKYYVGGVCGGTEGTSLRNCSNAGTVIGSERVGGVCGGFVGWYGAVFTNCYNTGIVGGPYANMAGGVCGDFGSGRITNCYNMGAVSGNGMVGSVCGTGGYSANCYYLADEETDTLDGTTFKIKAQFASGEVAYLLSQGCTIEEDGESITYDGSVWGQDLSKEDSYPVLDSTKKVYHGYACLDLVYSNTDDLTKTPGHHFDENGFCTRGDAYEPAKKAENGVYEIGNAGQLYWFAGLVNGDEKVCTEDVTQDLSAKAVLTADITVNTGVLNANGTLQADAESFRSWTPIGFDSGTEETAANGYSGTFDGQNHTVSGLYFNDANADEVGLFGYTAENSQISNVGITDSYFNGNDYVGAVCGKNEGIIRNCYNAGTVSGSKWVCGVSGYNNHYNARVANCYNIGTIHAKEAYKADGVAYSGAGQTYNSYYLAGCAADGTIFTDYYPNESKTAEQFTVGEVAYLLSQGYTFEWNEGGESYDGSVWGQDLSTKDTWPVLDSAKKVYWGYLDCSEKTYANEPLSETPNHKEFDPDGFCTDCGGYQPAVKNAKGIYEISNAGQLYWFAGLVNGTLDYLGQNRVADAVLTKDITVNSNVLKEDGTLAGEADSLRSWTPIGTDYMNQYAGTFDGQNHTISGLYLDMNEADVGLFGSIGYDYNDGDNKNARISNVNLVDSYFHAASNVGGLCGQSSSGTSIENCRNAGTVIGANHVGGICGGNGGTIQTCTNTGMISGTDSSIGGICGSDSGIIVNCYNTGAVSGICYSVGGVCGGVDNGTIVNSYNIGVVSGRESDESSSIGAVCGQNSYGTIVNCYYLEDCAAEGTTFNSTDGESKTEAQFASGEVAHLLDQEYRDIGYQITYDGAVWGQKLGEGGDLYPVFSEDKVYRNETYKGCTGNPGEPDVVYSNTKADPVYAEHTDKDTDGKCDICSKQLSSIITGRMLTDEGTTLFGNMTGLDRYPLDAEVTLAVPFINGYNFIGWYEYSKESPYYTGENLCTSRTYRFTAEADRDLVAVYKPTGNASLTINGGRDFTINGDQKTTEVTAMYQMGSQITVVCNESDFAYWKNSAGMVVSREKNYTFTVTGQETISAVFNTIAEDMATIVFESYYGQIMARDQYAEDADIPNLDLPFRYGYTAIGWDYDGDGVYDAEKDTPASALERAFASEEKLVKILPVYQLKEATYWIYVTDGTGEGEYRQNEVVTVVANAPRKGLKFSHWEDNNGNILSYNQTYQFFAASYMAYMNLRAVYVEDTEAVEAKGTTAIVESYADTELKKLIFVSMSTVPEGCTIDKAGAIATDNAVVGESGENFNASTAKYVMGDAWSGNSYRYTLSKENAKAGETWYVRAYLVYTDAEGNVHTLYGDMVSVTMQEK